MGIYNKLIAATFPSYAMRRLKAMSVTARYDAEKPSRTYKRKTETRGPNNASQDFNRVGKYVTREMEQNNDLVTAALDVFCTNLVGNGMVPEPLVLNKNGEPNKKVNDALAMWYRRWVNAPEVTHEYNDATAQWLEVRSLARDGDVLCRHHLGPRQNLRHGTKVPYSYQLMEGDMLAHTVTEHEGRAVVGGCEVGGFGRVVAYHIYRHHPEDWALGNMRANTQTMRVSAERMTMLKHTTRIGQLRGITKFAPIIKRLNDVFEIDETERVAARVAASYALAITKGDPMAYDADDIDTDTGERNITLRPGIVIDDLLPGEGVEVINSNRPNNALIPFRGTQLRSAAGGFGISYSSWSKDYNGTYSSQRQELVEQHRMFTGPWTLFIRSSCQPRYDRFVNAVADGLVKIPREVDRETLTDCIWTQPVVPWIDPLKEAKAWGELLDRELETIAGITRLRGKSPRDLDRQRQMEADDEPKEPAPDQQPGQPQQAPGREEVVEPEPQQDPQPGGITHIR